MKKNTAEDNTPWIINLALSPSQVLTGALVKTRDSKKIKTIDKTIDKAASFIVAEQLGQKK